MDQSVFPCFRCDIDDWNQAAGGYRYPECYFVNDPVLLDRVTPRTFASTRRLFSVDYRNAVRAIFGQLNSLRLSRSFCNLGGLSVRRVAHPFARHLTALKPRTQLVGAELVLRVMQKRFGF